MSNLTHLDSSGKAHMVDVGSKSVTRRSASATGLVVMKPETLNAIYDSQISKGEVLAVARIAGIMAAKQTDELIPLCHSLGLDSVEIQFSKVGSDRIRIDSHVSCTGKTGVEMEAIIATSIAAATIYDMCKAIDRGMIISEIKLVSKTGGKSGDFTRAE